MMRRSWIADLVCSVAAAVVWIPRPQIQPVTACLGDQSLVKGCSILLLY